MRRDIVTFGKYSSMCWEDVILLDIKYVKWVAKNHKNGLIREIASYNLDIAKIDAILHRSKKKTDKCIEVTKNSEESVVRLLGRDDARQLALNIFALTEA